WRSFQRQLAFLNTSAGERMKAGSFVKCGIVALALAGFCDAAQAQWSIGAADNHAAPSGQERFFFLVFSNPIAGKEQEFNDWYQNSHLGDLTQLPGWNGAQRFRLVTDVNPRPTALGYRW